MTFDEAIARATKKDEALSVLWFIGHLKAYYVEVCNCHCGIKVLKDATFPYTFRIS